MSAFAYWITPKGQVVKPDSRHILTVVKHPAVFGETKKTIEATFEKYGQSMYSNIEGKAREEVMLRVIGRGFIRVRQGGSRSNQHWSIQLNRVTPKANDAIWSWANQIIKDGTAKDKYADVVIHELGRGDKMTKSDLSSIASGKGIGENIEFKPVEILDESECENLGNWSDYAHEIDPDQLSENAKIELVAHQMKGWV